MKPLYERYVELKNKLAVLNGYDDLGDEWRSRYETDTFQEDVSNLYMEMEPLYKQLHAYIRYNTIIDRLIPHQTGLSGLYSRILHFHIFINLESL